MDLLGSWLFVLKRMELLKTFLQVDTALIEKIRTKMVGIFFPEK